jgi:predicted heme/steroid binding protein
VRYDLAVMARRERVFRRVGIPLRVIEPSKLAETELANLYVLMLRQIAARVRARILPAYQTALAEGVRDDVPDLGFELENLDPEVRRLVLTLTPELRRWVIKYEASHRAKWVAAAYTATGVDLATLLGPEDVNETLEAVIARNVSLVRNVGAEAQGRIADVVWRSYQKREPARVLARAIDEALQLGRKRALRIAADQLQKLSSALDQERRRQAGIEHWIWRWSHKKHGRPAHIARDGNIYTDKTAPEDLPGELPYCGCKAQAYLALDGAPPAPKPTLAATNAQSETWAKGLVLDNGRRDGVEWVAGYDVKTGERFSTISGTKNSAAVPADMLARMQREDGAVIAHHNHPSGRSLSSTDINLFRYPGTQGIWAHGHNGASYFAERGAVAVDYQTLIWLDGRVHDALQAEITAGRMTVDDAIWLQPHMTILAYEARGLVKYTHKAAKPLTEAIDRHRAFIAKTIREVPR